MRRSRRRISRSPLRPEGKLAPSEEIGGWTGKEERQGERELRRKVAELERALGRKTYELEIAGKPCCGSGIERARRPLPCSGR